MNNRLFPLPALLLLGFISGVFLMPAQAQDKAKAPAGEKKQTEITSNSFKLDLGKKIGTFSGNVVVKDPGFNLSSDELVVYFADGNKMEKLVARGNVKIKNGTERASESREAEYILAEKKIKLTGDPVVIQGENRITGTVITIYPDSDRMDVDGRSKVQFYLD